MYIAGITLISQQHRTTTAYESLATAYKLANLSPNPYQTIPWACESPSRQDVF
jgi:hypothetical protein